MFFTKNPTFQQKNGSDLSNRNLLLSLVNRVERARYTHCNWPDPTKQDDSVGITRERAVHVRALVPAAPAPLSLIHLLLQHFFTFPIKSQFASFEKLSHNYHYILHRKRSTQTLNDPKTAA